VGYEGVLTRWLLVTQLFLLRIALVIEARMSHVDPGVDDGYLNQIACVGCSATDLGLASFGVGLGFQSFRRRPGLSLESKKTGACE
jgi:hypothetical protein